jgi:hypothetical protein
MGNQWKFRSAKSTHLQLRNYSRSVQLRLFFDKECCSFFIPVDISIGLNKFRIHFFKNRISFKKVFSLAFDPSFHDLLSKLIATYGVLRSERL